MSWGESPQFLVIKKKWTVPLGQPRKTYGIESLCRFLLTMVFWKPAGLWVMYRQ